MTTDDLSDTKRDKALARLRERIVKTSSAGYVVTDERGTIHFANQRANRLFGVDEGGLEGRSVLHLFPVSQRDDLTARVATLARDSEIDSGAESGEREPMQWAARALLRSGLTIPVLITAEGSSEDGERTCVFCLNRTEVEEAPSNEPFSASEQLRHFAYLASHDLRSPLTKIGTLVRWMQEGLEDVEIPADSRRNLGRLTTQVQRLDTLMTGLLEYARAGETKDGATVVGVSELLADVVELSDPPPAFEVTWPKDLPTIECQVAPLKHTLLNLINNAVEHHDLPPGRVRIDCEFYEPGRVKFVVEDDGPGIPERQRDRVFDIFVTLGEARNHRDHGGVGLAIVKRMVQRAEGSIQVLPSTLGRGTRIEFTWPSDAGLSPGLPSGPSADLS